MQQSTSFLAVDAFLFHILSGKLVTLSDNEGLFIISWPV
jgi:hypothetical protein